MTIAETLLPEFDQEMATTRRLLERVPTEKGDFKPHEKSFSLAHLTQRVATMPGWITRTINDDHIDPRYTDLPPTKAGTRLGDARPLIL